MVINIFTDASVNTTSLNAAYAFYIGGYGGSLKLQRAGILKVKTASSNVAELHCITNAIVSLTRISLPKPPKKIYIHSDSLNCIDAINGSIALKEPGLKEVLDEIRYLCMEYCLSIGLTIRDYKEAFSFIHTKAHTKEANKRAQINAWCDREAKRFRKHADKLPIYPNRLCIINLQII